MAKEKEITKEIEKGLYRKSVGIMLINNLGQVFIAERLDASQYLQMPQGGVEDGESLAIAAKRELAEETSITSVEILQESESWHYYDIPQDIAKKLWHGKFKGQCQKWFLMRCLNEAEVNLQTQEPEFKSYKWVVPHEILKYVVPFKKSIYEKILQEFSKNITNIKPL